MSKENILDFLDPNGKRYIWPRKLFDEHLSRHTELRNPSFIGRVKTIICHPDFIYPAYKQNNGFCFYLSFQLKSPGIKRYTKVFVIRNKKLYIIVTAFTTTHIKELKYNLKICQRP